MNQAAAGGRNKVRDGFRFAHAVPLRKVRAPQGMMPGNTRAEWSKGLSDRQCNRKYTAGRGFGPIR
ncbi:hypothetical protein FACS1894110_03440 [Spirochaetia bacterium]|nr:hypothetical protein FACS1894110_03440 [Spirochaetia bacterium]